MRAVFGVIGHVDHGKTALVQALTGMDTDRLAEERRRGISIVLGFAHFTAGDVAIDLVDMPGHERFVRTMVAGATGMTAALLVVAANEGIKPQTIEHLDIAALLGVHRVVIAVSKIDLVGQAEAAAAAGAAARLAAERGLDAAAGVLTSARSGAGIAALRAALADAAGAAERGDDGFAYLPIDRAFSLPGAGTVVTGTLRRGALSVSDPLAIAPDGRAVRLRGLQVHGTRVATALPGQRVAANLRDIQPAELPHGAALTAAGLLPAATRLTVSLRAVAGAAPLPSAARVMLLVGTEEVAARLRLLDRDILQPGQAVVAQLRCARPIAVPAREAFVLRRPSPPLTIAGGRVIDPAATRVRRHAAGALAHLAALADAAPAEIMQLELAAAGAAGVTLTRLAQLAGLAPARAAALLPADVVMCRGGVVVLKTVFARVTGTLPALLAAHPAGLTRERLAALLADAAPVLDDAIADLVRRKLAVSDAGTLRLPHSAQARADSEAAAAQRLAEQLRQAGLTPPALAPGPQGQRLANLLVRRGLAVRAIDHVQKREFLFHAEAVELAKRRLAPLLSGPPGLLVGEAGAALGISRKYCVPLLEHLDAIGFTRRNADRRVLARKEAVLF